MKEMLLVGRGGEGVVLASQILADALGRAGYRVQSFPEFKAERRGAPISALLRWDDAPIHRRYKMTSCDVLASVSPAKPSAELLARVRPGGLVILNRETRLAESGPFGIARVPASRVARRHGVLSAEARPMGNTAVLGACVKLLLPEGLAHLEQAIADRMGSRAERNVDAAREGYALATVQRRLAGDLPLEPPVAVARREVKVLFPVSTTDTLSNHTGSWSLDRPVLREACTACALCALFCPEGVITRANGAMTIDERYCKGCGICAVVCPVKDAIGMEAVRA